MAAHANAHIDSETRLVALLGHPVSHSLSPRMQNAAFRALGLNWAYIALDVEPDRVREAVRGLAALGFAGANVTIPHKTAVIPFCDEVDPEALRAQSVNTLVIRDGRIHGSSTDGLAVTQAVRAAGERALVLGAGGAAKAVAVALAEAGAEVVVAARRPEQAEVLARLCGGTTAAWPPSADGYGILLNTTPVKDAVAVAPVPGQQVVDMAYNRDGTPTALVAAARAAGCGVIVDGADILAGQGAASFARWTGVEAPVAVMRAALDLA
jgi:shikimate dehydrogenase